MTGLEALSILFIALKLTGVIAWSWWWVLLPVYIGIPITIIALAIAVIAGGRK